MSFIEMEENKLSRSIVIIEGGVLQSGYDKWITPTRRWDGGTYSPIYGYGYSDSGYWGAYHYAKVNDAGGDGSGEAIITFKPECYGKTCTVRYYISVSGAGTDINAWFIKDGSYIYKRDAYRTGWTQEAEYTFTIPSSGSPYIRVYGHHTDIESSGGWAGYAYVGFKELIIS